MSVSTEGGLDLTTEQALWLLREMLRIRRVEEALARSYAQGLIPGACHTYVGQEAIAVGVCAHLRPDDVVFSTHRGHGHALAKGAPAREVMAELFGKATGVSKGRGGSMHLFVPEVGLMGTTGIVGPNILQATGAGYSFQLMKTDQVSVAFFGDGATNNGAFHEGVNMAAIWGLPVVYVCENNQFATEVPFDYATRNTDVAERARTYGIPGVTVDGNDVLAVTEAAQAAIERARSGGGPSLIEGKTYRTRPHAEGMRDGGYRTVEEIEAWKSRDPIALLEARLLDREIATQEQIDAVRQEVEDVVADGLEFAKTSPYPEPDTAALHIYGKN
ncbi:MAG TPA: thiamine pyrophosphate-dependent dehydrogenase E1 component subunit alpha [Thermomicrobiales bacterium]|nr:thiamine pyrophosphate-dependent dehydrogenase E1 component subunit alpha [Thermomicrobiales bacterium]